MGNNHAQHKYDMQPVQTRVLALPMEPRPRNDTLLALPAPEPKTEEARDYNELMDEYSLHELIIRRGRVLDQTPEFNSFKRTFVQKWGQISYILMLLEKLLMHSSVEMAYIDGRKVAALCYTSDIDLNSKPTEEELFECVQNKDEVAA